MERNILISVILVLLIVIVAGASYRPPPETGSQTTLTLAPSTTKEQLIMEAYNWNLATNTLTGAFRNVGPLSINIQASDVFINGIPAGHPGGTCTGNLEPGESCSFSIALPSRPSWTSGAAYPLKIVTPIGGVFSYSVIAGGNS